MSIPWGSVSVRISPVGKSSPACEADSWLQNFRRLLVRHLGLLAVSDGFFYVRLGCVLLCVSTMLK
ncbi:MAG: hypothetical protein G01um101438_392 [Parcubacteria group bacterium Gr01-1014_38]|nr:MAG: hypothetical protein G01um101438_392 [Parcubacteria group bacterium Gr01-1014_38]